ncbi:carbohydrate binding domain-containing protein [Halalkalibacter urbisdiaboli]|uniref:carbohydrate binding domain-containing protein n=1 Tax=Halalkalibacter urbisdiaboli TaxID=1960589 RepID=UPI001A98068A|nr:carbohydrate binding domain-containing protein [Halalkalibacter urbisdiaboli]
MTDRFEDGDPSNNQSYGRVQEDAHGHNIGTFHGGDLKGLTNKLHEGYFTDLGINAIWITAPYEQIHGWVGGGEAGDFAHYAYHGYYALDYTTVDQNMGTVEEMREFVDTAHENNIRVVLDIVMNHPGYNTLMDMENYNFGNPGLDANWTPSNGETWHEHHDYINYDDSSAWSNWWGDWVRADIAGYEQCGNSEKEMCLAGLPDFRTDLTNSVGLPPLLEEKWKQEQSGYDEWIVPAAEGLRQDLGLAPADYIIEWLSAWVEEFGIDGFRIDTAKHVELSRWEQLKHSVNEALWTWRERNPNKPGANWSDDFWMVGEVWGHGVGKSEYFEHGFDSVINFTFQGEHGNGSAYDLDRMEEVYSSYASDINSDPEFNVLSYLSQHDTALYNRDRLIDGGTYLLMLPGGVQTFYGDETARPFGPTGSDSHQGTRSPMNWDSPNEQVLNHWKKLGQFRNNHLAIGAGEHSQIQSEPYTFSRTFEANGREDKVVVVVGASGTTNIDVSSVFANGQTVQDFYTGNSSVVEEGTVTFDAHATGVILIEREGDSEPKEPVKPSAPNNLQSTNTTDTETTLTWGTPTQQVNGYEVFRNGEKIAETTSTRFTDGYLTPETTYSYTVTAFNDVGTSEKSEPISVTTRAEGTSENLVTIYYQGFSTPYIHYQPEGGEWTEVPGKPLSPSSSYEGYYEITIDLEDAEGLVAAFNDGNGQWDNNNGNNYHFSGGTYTFRDGQITEGEPNSVTTIYYQTSWETPHIHYAIGSGEWTSVPGVVMERSSRYPDYATITIELGSDSELAAAFNNGNGQWDNNNGNDYRLGSAPLRLKMAKLKMDVHNC